MTLEKTALLEIKKCFANMNGDGAWRLDMFDDLTYAYCFDGYYGVMIESGYPEEIDESFSNVYLSKRSFIIAQSKQNLPSDIVGKTFLTLSCPLDDDGFKDKFILLCYDFIYTDSSNIRRKQISENPFKWWADWKKLVGNVDRNIRAYPVLGELVALDILNSRGLDPVWEGPGSGLVDIRCKDSDYEVKSTTGRYTDEITLSSQLQLKKTEGRDLHLIYVCFEESSAGVTINAIVEKLVSKGFDRMDLENNLSRLGLSRGNSSRKTSYDVLKVWDFTIDDEFPKITPDMFTGGRLPRGIKKITYTVDLSGLSYRPIDYDYTNLT